jgi:hypothetical protein
VPVSLEAWEPATWMCSVVTAELMSCAWVAAVSRAFPAEPVPEPVPVPVPDDAAAAAPVLAVAPLVLFAELLAPEEHAASRASAAADRPMVAVRREEAGIEVTQKRYKVCAGLAGQ